MRGKLDVLPVHALLRFALREDRSGVLELERGGQHGRIAFQHGWVLEAISPAVRGRAVDRLSTEQALAELIGWTTGEFSLDLMMQDCAREVALEIDLSRLVREALIARA